LILRAGASSGTKITKKGGKKGRTGKEVGAICVWPARLYRKTGQPEKGHQKGEKKGRGCTLRTRHCRAVCAAQAVGLDLYKKKKLTKKEKGGEKKWGRDAGIFSMPFRR